MPSIQLLAATVDELIKVTGTILHSGVLGRMLRNIGRKIAERAYYRYKLSAPQFSGGRMNEYVKAATSIPLWPSEPLNITSEQITFEVKECPFGLPPADNPQYCQITSGFFGGLATQHFGRARVEVIQGGGRPSKHCRIHVRIGRLADSPSASGELFEKAIDDIGEFSRSLLDVNLLQPLSVRELTILRMVGEGLTSKEIAESLHSSVRTIENTIARISNKLGIRGRAKLIRIALRYSLPSS
ncbi:MAG: LuxR C-terminal-related transcriptional regulator [Nitrospirota bacterium]